MKPAHYSACATLLSFVFAAPCLAASSPWDGTWKLNQSKSKMTGEVFVLTALPNGGFHRSDNSGSVQIDYLCNGKDYVIDDRRTGTCIKVDDHHYKMAGKLNGQPSWEGTSVVSPDNKFLTNTANARRPDGTTSTVSNKYERIGSGTGRAGTWKNVKSTDSAPEIFKMTLNGDSLRIDDLTYKSVAIAKLDGSPAHLEGPDVPKALGMTFKSEGNLKHHMTSSYNGKPFSEGYETLSADGRTLTQVSWDPGKSDDKQIYFYEKQ
jgi:hypothetical protein